MKYKESSSWKTAEKHGNIRKAVDLLFEELRVNYEFVANKQPSTERTIVRNLYFSIAYRQRAVSTYSEERLHEVLKDLKEIRTNIKKYMRLIK